MSGQAIASNWSHQRPITCNGHRYIYIENIDTYNAKVPHVKKLWELKVLKIRNQQVFHILANYLGDIEAKDEFERQENLVIVAKDTKPFKGLFGLLVLTDEKPVGEPDQEVEETVEEELFPDTLEETGTPDAEDLENVSPAGGGDDVLVRDCHCQDIGLEWARWQHQNVAEWSSSDLMGTEINFRHLLIGTFSVHLRNTRKN